MPTLRDRLQAAVDEIALADSHEHLMQEPARLATGDNCLLSFFHHYASSDLVSAGLSPAELELIRDGAAPLDRRLDTLWPWWQAITNTSYARALVIAAADLYGVELTGKAAWRRLCERFAETNKPGWYRHVMKEKAKIEVSLLDEGGEVDRAYFRQVIRMDHIVAARTLGELQALRHRHEHGSGLAPIERQTGVAIHTLEGLVAALDVAFDRAREQGAVGIKTGLAYHRTLDFAKVTRHEAEVVFNRIFAGRGEGPGWHEARPLQDYLMHQVIKRCQEHHLPLQIHTGIQEGNGNDLRNANPTHLIPLFVEYPAVRFDIFHAGYPWSTELAVMAKAFPNVYPDLAWVHAITEYGGRRILHEWLDTVPANKIFGFGGDYRFIEGAYAHARMARRNTAWVLAEKVEWGQYTEEAAVQYARWLLHDNLCRVYDLETKRQPPAPRGKRRGSA